MAVPKIELVSEGLKHSLKINGVDMNQAVRRAVVVIESGRLVHYELSYGDPSSYEPAQAEERFDATVLSSTAREWA